MHPASPLPSCPQWGSPEQPLPSQRLPVQTWWLKATCWSAVSPHPPPPRIHKGILGQHHILPTRATTALRKSQRAAPGLRMKKLPDSESPFLTFTPRQTEACLFFLGPSLSLSTLLLPTVSYPDSMATLLTVPAISTLPPTITPLSTVLPLRATHEPAHVLLCSRAPHGSPFTIKVNPHPLPQRSRPFLMTATSV